MIACSLLQAFSYICLPADEISIIRAQPVLELLLQDFNLIYS